MGFGGTKKVSAEKVVTPATAQEAQKQVTSSESADDKSKRSGIVQAYNRFSPTSDTSSGGTSSTLG